MCVNLDPLIVPPKTPATSRHCSYVYDTAITHLKKLDGSCPVAGGSVASGQLSMGTSMLWKPLTSGATPDTSCLTSRSAVAAATYLDRAREYSDLDETPSKWH